MWERVDGTRVKRLGQGTWKMGEDPIQRQVEIDALKAGFDEDLWLVDTAEMYAEGGSERVVGEAIRGVRDKVFLTTKVWPTHGSVQGIEHSLAESLKRLKTDAVDLYLLHWPSLDFPLKETMAGLQAVLKRGMTRHIGVSNFPWSLWDEAWSLTDGAVKVNQVDFSLGVRTPELSLLPYAARQGASLMAYSPLRNVLQEDLTAERRATLTRLAEKHGVSVAALALAWLLVPRSAEVVVIAKTSQQEHIRQNARALDVRLSEEDCQALEALYPLPKDDLTVEAY